MLELLGPAIRKLDRLRRRAEYVRGPALLRKVTEELRGVFIHPTAMVHRDATLQTGRDRTIVIGPGTHVHAGAMLYADHADIRIGARCSVNPYTVIYGGATIGDGVRIAAHCVIIPSNHEFDDVTRPIVEQGFKSRGVKIGDDCWLASRVVVLDGAEISSGCVIGAGAIVSRSTVTNGIYVGTPAKLLRLRGNTRA